MYTYGFDESKMFINLDIISVFKAFGIPSSPCIKLLNNLITFSKIFGTFSSTNLSTNSIKILFFPNIYEIPSVFYAKSNNALYVYSRILFNLSLIRDWISRIQSFFIIVLRPNYDIQIFFITVMDNERI